MMQVGFIGLGDMGMYQVRSFAQAADCQIVAGADPSPEMRARFAEHSPDAQLFDSPEALLKGAAVDGVVVAVPTGYHQQVANAVIDARVPLLLEKPMARTVAQCAQLIERAEQKNTLLMVAHCRRFDPYWTTWGKMVTSGELGTPILWRDAAARINNRGWFMDDALGGGPLLDGAIHNYDFANWLFGKPESIYASALKLNANVSAVDTATAVICYPGGHQLMVSWSWGARGHSLRDIVGPNGFIQFGTGSQIPPKEEKGLYQYLTLTNRDGNESLIKVDAKPDMYVRQAEHFFACIRDEASCQSPGREAIKAVAVAEAILQSTRDGKIQEITR